MLYLSQISICEEFAISFAHFWSCIPRIGQLSLKPLQQKLETYMRFR